MKNLVVYFSATGTTKKVAENLAEVCNGDLFEIIPEEPYTAADLNWNDSNSRSTVEKNNPSIRPVIINKVNLEAYQKIYLGFPIWWGIAPNIINTFLESYDFNGKTVIPFGTSGGSGISYAENDLKNKYPSINFKSGRLFSSYANKQEYNDFVGN